MISTPRAADWSEYATAADNTEVVLTRDAGTTGLRHYITSLGVSFDSTATSPIEIYGLTKVGPLDLTDTSVLNLTTDIFTLANHGLANNEQVVFHTLGGTAPTGLTSGTTYYVIRTNANSFQLEASVGGGAIDMSGTQSTFATEAAILPLNKKKTIYDHLEADFSSPWMGAPRAPFIIKAAAVTSVQALVDVSGYTL